MDTSAPAPHIGAVYAENATGDEYTLSGLRSRGQVFLAENSTGSGRIIDRLPLEELAGRFTFVRCNHDDFCCTAHRTHTSPHRGCLLR
ncbi:hypothetical protein [Arthrobacter caoxuetaonis]|uniref:Uncharacterized protein n=1 Tax=Arthrobacter caoxuetaonis TaxID=2886935 RepID=A0A9X1SD84_9MICC|nr:hypothetical protein [Arthrobacter caoxuetaonis]MCC3299395.1 hypothetical protein [Arthrobacter caoxuetaonis]USQ59112.1 hypothetical protein NF551_18575 [Arthrobacter caoxuetaonis]